MTGGPTGQRRWKMTLLLKLLLSFVAILVLSDVGIAVALSANGAAQAALKTQTSQLIPAYNAVQSMEQTVYAVDDKGAWRLMQNSPAQQQTLTGQYNTLVSSMNGYVQTALQLAPTAASRNDIVQFQSLWQTYLTGNNSAFALQAAGHTAQAQAGFVSTTYTTIMNGLRDYMTVANTLEEDNADRVSALAARAQTLGYAFAGGATLLGVLIAILVSLSISRPLAAMAADARRIAGGDLTGEDREVRGQDEVAELGRAFTAMTANMRSLVLAIADSSQRLAAASEELTAGSEQTARAVGQVSQTIQEVASGATTQNGKVSGTAETMRQLQTAIEQVARGAQQQASAVQSASQTLEDSARAISGVAGSSQEVSAVAREALASAQHGGRAVEETLSGIERIRVAVLETAGRVDELGRRSQQIGEITQTIGDIADQTNLLALNAAIEAARAGEHGKGFAVVADAVRQLAERSSKAAKEIEGLIAAIAEGTQAAVDAMKAGTAEVEQGNRLAAQTGQALTDILASMERTNTQVHAITEVAQRIAASSGVATDAMTSVAAVTEENTAATEEMAASSNEVTGAMTQVVAVSQQTAAAAEEVSAAAQEMSATTEQVASSARGLAGMAQELQAVVNRFQVRARDRAA